MALLNFSVPFSSSPFLSATNFNSLGAASSLVFDSSRTRNSPTPPPVPSRKPATNPRTNSHNDPYSGHYEPQQRPPRYYREDAYKANSPKPLTSSVPFGKSNYPSRPSGFTKIESNPGFQQGAKTTVHAVLDYDDDDDFDDYYDDDDDVPGELPPEFQHARLPPVTPIQGPIFIKNNSVPVVPLYSYPMLNNGTIVQIPILWTALSLALGLEIRGEIIRGVPCIKRNHQLFCPTAGNSYPIDRIEQFIDENKALMKRMYGEFQMTTDYGQSLRETYDHQLKRTVKRDTNGKKQPLPGVPDLHGDPGGGGPDPAKDPESRRDSYFSKLRETRQSFRNNQSSESGRIDACESKVEIVTPYWATNSASKVRAIVNTEHFEQAIHQEVCSKSQTKRCSGDCGCEQKYKWHRLLAYDPDNDCKGIFMDWFLFPSCCVCRCSATFGN